MTALMFALTIVAADPKLPPGFDPTVVETIARSAILEALPGKYEDTKEWNKQQERPGLKFTGQGFKTRIRKDKKRVNHGLWKQYRIEPVDPHKRLTLNLENIAALPGGGLSFKVAISSPLFARATIEQWIWGAKLLGMTVEGEATATLILDCRVVTHISIDNLVPRLVLAPTIVDATLVIDEFKLTKLGEFPRKLARELSDEARKIAEKYLRKQEHKVLEKANAAIAKKGTNGQIVLTPAKWLE